jgi:hypothetical protein
MKLLNELYNKSCIPKCENYIKISNDITLIDNFFENFELAKNFFTSRDKWKCIQYQGHSKPGYESLFPSWIGKSLMEKFILDNKIVDDMNSYKIVCNFFYNELSCIWNISNSCYYPHIDSVQYDDMLMYICLINLNNIPVFTKFYTYKDKEYSNNKNEFDEYTEKIKNELTQFYIKENITGNELKVFLDRKKKLDIKLIREIKYNPNQAIIYPANLFHSPNIDQEFTEDNPRVLLRIIFDRKIVEHKNNFMYQ